MYGELCARFYDLDKPAAPAGELAFWAELLGERPGRVLEPMCGSGRFLVPLVARGIEVDGVDASRAMLDACRRRLDAAGATARLTLARVEEMRLDRLYDVALIPAGSFGLLGDPAAALRRIRENLVPGGRLLFDFERPGVDEDGERRRSVRATAVSWTEGRTWWMSAAPRARFRHDSELHGEKHAARVMVHAMDLADRCLRFPETAPRIPFAERLLAESRAIPPGPELLRRLLEIPG